MDGFAKDFEERFLVEVDIGWDVKVRDDEAIEDESENEEEEEEEEEGAVSCKRRVFSRALILHILKAE